MRMNTPAVMMNERAAIRSKCLWIVGLVFLVALVTRLVWVCYVQNPADAIHSDMEGYIERAQKLVSGEQVRHWSVAVLPYGTHYLYAVEMLLFGSQNYTAMTIVHVIGGAVCVACITWAASYCLHSVFLIGMVGLVSCFWYPMVAFNGFFSSEIPYSVFMYLGLLFTFRFIESGKGAGLTGLLQGIAFTIRPQMIMTSLLFMIWVIIRRRSVHPLAVRRLVWIALPIGAIVAYSACRYCYFTGDVRLISGNDAVTRLLGCTDYWVCVGYIYEDGKPVYQSGFARLKLAAWEPQFSFEGRLIDTDVIDQEIKSWRSRASMLHRVWVRMRNLILLFAYEETMWPEWTEARGVVWRYALFHAWHWCALFCWLPLVVLGLIIGLRQRNPYLEVIGLHVLTLGYAAFAYLGQIRYRIPYDLMLMIPAVLAAPRIFAWISASDRVAPEEASSTTS